MLILHVTDIFFLFFVPTTGENTFRVCIPLQKMLVCLLAQVSALAPQTLSH